MNVLIIVDKWLSAIHRLAVPIEKYNRHFNVRIFPVHPKRNDVATISEAQWLMVWADVIDIHYWKSGEILRRSFPTEFEAKPRVVCHFNPYDFDKENWPDIYDATVVGNETIRSKIPYARLIPYCVDLGFWKYKPEVVDEKVVNMCVARIEGKKGIKEVAQACRELEYKFILVGRVSDDNYMREVMEAGGEFIEFKENATDEELRDVYYGSAIHVCNSTDNFESGTLPILECMACGTPVLTRSIGHVPDIYDGKNMEVRMGTPEDVTELKEKLRLLMENHALRAKFKENAWQTVKNRQDEKMARMFSDLYYKLVRKNHALVSVIVPTFDRQDSLIDCLAAIVKQDYPSFEIVVVDSGDIPMEDVVRGFRAKVKVPIKYVRFENKGEYTLPKARNLGVIEAEGEILVFCDDRLEMQLGAISAFAEAIKPRHWLWGIKDGVQKGFVENFSSVLREDLVSGGMFNERIDRYGGQTQEIRERFEKRNGVFFLPVARAQAVSLMGSKAKWRKREDIARSKLTLWKMYG